jgi:hypothetical protein
VEQIAHGIYKNHRGLFPSERGLQLMGMGYNREAFLVITRTHGLEPFGHARRVTIQATRAYFGTPRHGVPGILSPFDGRSGGHYLSRLFLYFSNWNSTPPNAFMVKVRM